MKARKKLLTLTLIAAMILSLTTVSWAALRRASDDSGMATDMNGYRDMEEEMNGYDDGIRAAGDDSGMATDMNGYRDMEEEMNGYRDMAEEMEGYSDTLDFLWG